MFMLGTISENSDLTGLTNTTLEIRNSTDNLISFFDNTGNLKLYGSLNENHGSP